MKRALKDVRELLSEPNRWIKGETAKDNKGHIVSWWDPAACQFCLTGAMIRATGNQEKLYNDMAKLLIRCSPRFKEGAFGLYKTNDHKKMTHKKLISWLDKAIEDEI